MGAFFCPKQNRMKSNQQPLWHPFDVLEIDQEILVDHAKGVFLYTSDGRKITDAISSWWVNIHGHSHPKLNEVLFKQASQLEHVIFSGFTHAPAKALAQILVENLPGNMAKVFLSDDGSTAVEVGIKMALQYWYNRGTPKSKIVALEGAYHGDTFGAMSVGERSIFNAPFNSLLFDVHFLPFPSHEDVVSGFESYLTQNDVAAFIYEPLVQGAAGMRMYPKEILEGLLAVAKRYHVLCIADEVMTGFGRTGTLFASNQVSTSPDIICLSKGITGGYMALGATTCTAEVFQPFDSNDIHKLFFHGHSYTGNPLVCALAVESWNILSSQYPFYMEAFSLVYPEFAKKLEEKCHVQHVRILGSILAFEVVADGAVGYTNSLRNQLYSLFLDANVLLRPLGNTLYLLPPLSIGIEELQNLTDSVLEVLEKNFPKPVSNGQ